MNGNGAILAATENIKDKLLGLMTGVAITLIAVLWGHITSPGHPVMESRMDRVETALLSIEEDVDEIKTLVARLVAQNDIQ